tara:strand:+ start:1724 stop:3901 length:2178 start_codon:yes stop_codon:yes gene_type:complete
MTDYQNDYLLPRRRLRFGRDFRPAPPITEEFEIDTDTDEENDRQLLTAPAAAASVVGDLMSGGLEPLSEQKPFSSEGQMGGQQKKSGSGRRGRDITDVGTTTTTTTTTSKRRGRDITDIDDDDLKKAFDLGEAPLPRTPARFKQPQPTGVPPRPRKPFLPNEPPPDAPKEPTPRQEFVTGDDPVEPIGEPPRPRAPFLPKDTQPKDEFHDDNTLAKDNHIHEAATTNHQTTALFGNKNDMIPFAQPNYEVQDTNFFSSTVALSAQVVRENAQNILGGILNESGEAFVDRLVQISGLGNIGMVVKEPMKDVMKSFIDNEISPNAPMRPLSQGKKNVFAFKEMQDPAVYPFLVLGIEFYIAHLSEQFEAPRLTGMKGMFIRGYVEQIFDAIDLGENDKRFMYYIINNVPNELLTAFRKNMDVVSELSEQETNAIDKFTSDVVLQYKDIFGSELFRDLEKEHAGDTLFEMLVGLSFPSTLHQIAMTIETIDTLIYDVANNKGLFLSLMTLIGNQGNKDNLVNEFSFLHNVIEGLVYYDRTGVAGGLRLAAKKDVEFIMEANNLDDEVIMRESDNDVYIIFRGTDVTKKGDIIRNIMQKANSQETTFDPKVSQVYQRGLRMVEEAKNIAQAKGGDVKIVGYSMGSYPALYLSLNHPSIETNIYNPYFSQKQQTRNLLTALKDRESNLNVFAVQGDPVSVGLTYYKDLLKPKIIKASKFFNPHDIRSYLQ